MDAGRKLARNLALVMSYQLVTSVLGAVTTLLLPLFLGDVGLGRLRFAQSIAIVILSLCGLGTNVYIAREIASDRRRLGSMVSVSLLLRVPIWILMAVGIVGAVIVFRRPAPEAQLVLIAFAASAIVPALAGVLDSALQGLEEMRPRAIGSVSAAVTVLLLGLPLLYLTHSPLVFVGVLTAGALVDIVINIFYLHRLHFRLSAPSLTAVRAAIAGSVPFFLIAVPQGIYNQLDLIMLGLLASEAVVGWFAAATGLQAAITLIPLVLVYAGLPALARLKERPEAARAALRQLLRLLMLAVLPVASGLAVIAPRLFHFLHYPPVFSHSVPILMILTAAWMLSAILMIVVTAMIAWDHERTVAKVTLVFLPIFAALFLTLIPLCSWLFGNGGLGAAAADVLGEGAMLVTYFFLLPKGVITRESLWHAARAGMACAVMVAGVFFVLPYVHLLVAVAAGVVLYAAASAVLQTVTREELAFAQSVLRKQVEPPAPLAEVTPPTETLVVEQGNGAHAVNNRRRPIRILFLFPVDFYGNPDLMVVTQVLRHLDPERHRAYLMLNSNGHGDLNLAGARNLEVRTAPFGSSIRSGIAGAGLRHLPLSTASVAVYAARGEIDIVHTGSTPRAAVLGWTIARAAGAKLLLHCLQRVEQQAGVRRDVEIQMLRRADRLVAASSYLAADLVRSAGVSPHKLDVVMHGTDIERFRPGGADGRKIRAELGIPTDVPLALQLGRLVPDKRAEDFVQALAIARQTVPNLHGLLVGWEHPAPFPPYRTYRQMLESISATAGLNGSLVLAPSRPDTPALMAAADMLVHPCDVDVLPLVVAEAMAAGLPVIAADAGGIPEQVVDGETGLLVPPRSPSALAEKMVVLAQDPDLRRRLGEAGRARAKSLFTEQRVADEFAAVYARLAG